MARWGLFESQIKIDYIDWLLVLLELCEITYINPEPSAEKVGEVPEKYGYVIKEIRLPTFVGIGQETGNRKDVVGYYAQHTFFLRNEYSKLRFAEPQGFAATTCGICKKMMA